VGTSTSLHKYLAAESLLDDGVFLQVTVNREEFLKIRERPRIPVTSKTDGQHFKPKYAELKNIAP